MNDWTPDGLLFGSVGYLAETYWAFRTQPNIWFLHYRDLMADLDSEVRRLSDFLGIPVDEARWPGLVEAENQALYERLSVERMEPRLKAWLECGRAAGVDPKAA